MGEVIVFQELIDLGINPRIAIALVRMASQNRSVFGKTASKGLTEGFVKEANHLLCAGIKRHFGKESPEAEVEEGLENSQDEDDIREDERKLARRTVKLAYALAKNLGADEVTALTASMYAFTQIPAAHEVQSEILKAEWWYDGK